MTSAGLKIDLRRRVGGGWNRVTSAAIGAKKCTPVFQSVAQNGPSNAALLTCPYGRVGSVVLPGLREQPRHDLGSNPEASQIYHFRKKLKFQQQQKQQRSMTSSTSQSAVSQSVGSTVGIPDNQVAVSQPTRSASRSIRTTESQSVAIGIKHYLSTHDTSQLAIRTTRVAICVPDNQSGNLQSPTTGAQFVSSGRPERQFAFRPTDARSDDRADRAGRAAVRSDRTSLPASVSSETPS
jgi:hypothetical protein